MTWSGLSCRRWNGICRSPGLGRRNPVLGSQGHFICHNTGLCSQESSIRSRVKIETHSLLAEGNGSGSGHCRLWCKGSVGWCPSFPLSPLGNDGGSFSFLARRHNGRPLLLRQVREMLSIIFRRVRVGTGTACPRAGSIGVAMPPAQHPRGCSATLRRPLLLIHQVGVVFGVLWLLTRLLLSRCWWMLL